MSTQRIESIDILRGLTIAFMIIVNTPGSWSFVYAPLQHAEWHGCTPTDLVFPFFTFIVGLSLAESFKTIGSEKKLALFGKVAKRAGLIFLIGLLINYYPFFNKELSNLRIYGVLQRIAVAYFIASTIIITRPKSLLLPIIFLGSIVYYLLLIIDSQSPFDLLTNAVRDFDMMTIGDSHMYKGFEDQGKKIAFDPEGLLGGLSTAVNVLLGYYLGDKMKGYSNNIQKIKYALGFGLCATLVGLLWASLGYPINNPLWTGSYAFFTSGLCAILFGIVLYIVDELQIRKWAWPFKILGMNALASFALSGLVVKTMSLIKFGNPESLTTPYAFFYKNIMSPLFGPYLGSLLLAVCFCALIWSIAYAMYRKKIFLKV